MDKTLIVIIGPTGIGKTKTAILLAKHFGAEIISADSRQVFKELRIGTAVPSDDELQEVKHHFIHTRSIAEYYNASMFESEVLAQLSQIFKKSPVAVMAGGSMLYIDAVCKGIDDLPTVDEELRKSLIEKFETEGIESLRFKLKQLDPEYYLIADLKNPKRILHALEICLMTGKTYSSFRKNTARERPFKIIKIGLTCDRELLYNRINRRVDQMVEAGLEKEARSVYPLRHLNSLNTVGYREMFDYFDGKTSFDEAIEKIKANTRKYARKQLTWFRNDPSVKWFMPEGTEQIISYIDSEINSNGTRAKI